MSNEDTTQSNPVIGILCIVWHLVQTGILLYGLCITGYLLVHFTIGERWMWVAFANNFIPWWALGGIIAGGIALLSRWRSLLVGLQLPVLVAFGMLYGPLLLSSTPPVESNQGTPLTVATYNIISYTSNPQHIKAVITSLDADVIGLQEVGPIHAALFTNDLVDRYPYQALYPRASVHGIGLLSRYPIVEQELVSPLPDSMLYLRVVLDLDSTFVTVYVVHPPPPYNIRSITRYNDTQRDAEIDILCEDYLQQETGPLIVLGDFNMTDQSDAYQRIDALLDDAFLTAGCGLGFTYPDRARAQFRLFPLLLRIDYVWYNTHLTAQHVYVGKDSGTSDHRPVIADLVLHKDSFPAE